MSERDAYASAGVSTSGADAAVTALVSVLGRIDPGRKSLAQLRSGHYANVLKVADNLGVAISTDGVGSKVIVAEQLGRFDTVGIDCIAMNVNDLICVGAEPLAMVDYIAVELADPAMLEQIAEGLRAGAEDARIEIPGGELAQLPELIKSHAPGTGFDLVGAAFGTVALDAMVTGDAIAPGDTIVGVPSSGVHSNGLTLARRALIEQGGLELGDRPDGLGRSLGDELIEPTTIYVRAVLELLRAGRPVHGLAHITSGGLCNLLRLNADVGYRVDAPLAPQPVFALIAEHGGVEPAEMYEVFNMGCGFCVVVPADAAGEAVELLAAHHPGTAAIGQVTAEAGVVSAPPLGLVGDRDGMRAAA